MDAAIRNHFQEGIKERRPLAGGYSFKTWLLTLTSGRRLVFRTGRNFVTGGGREIIIADIFEREKFFYDRVNTALGHICPNVYVIDGSCEHYEAPYQIAEYLEGTPLYSCFDDLTEKQKHDISYRFGEITAGINSIEIEAQHPYVLSRGIWEDFFAKRLRERLVAIVKNDLITFDEIDKIIDSMQDMKAERSLSFLHLDLRFENMILGENQLYLLDAENCEFGDPLFEFAVLDMNNYLSQPFLAGYKSSFGEMPDLGKELYPFYQMERCALVLDVFKNEVKDGASMAQPFLILLNELKKRLL